MKSVFVVILVVTILPNIHAQSTPIELSIYFLDACDNKIKKLEFILWDENSTFVEIEYDNPKVDSPGSYMLGARLDMLDGDYGALVGAFLYIDEFGAFTDTIFIPQIRFVGSNALHSSYWNYFKCNRLCNGVEVGYYPNGNIRLKGEFVEGKPILIQEYATDGTLECEKLYTAGKSTPFRENYFDEEGQLDEYLIRKYRKNKIIVKTYDKSGKILDK